MKKKMKKMDFKIPENVTVRKKFQKNGLKFMTQIQMKSKKTLANLDSFICS